MFPKLLPGLAVGVQAVSETKSVRSLFKSLDAVSITSAFLADASRGLATSEAAAISVAYRFWKAA